MIRKAWFLLRIMENFSWCEKNSSILHVTKFPALQQILELHSDPNEDQRNYRMGTVCLAQISLLHQWSTGDTQEGI